MINLPGARPVLNPADFTGLENAIKGEGNVPCFSKTGTHLDRRVSRSDLEMLRMSIRETLCSVLNARRVKAR